VSSSPAGPAHQEMLRTEAHRKPAPRCLTSHCVLGMAGLVVDRMVTHPFEFNFYLNAHVRSYCCPLHHNPHPFLLPPTPQQAAHLTYFAAVTHTVNV